MYNRSQSMNNLNKNRAYFIRCSTQDQYNRYSKDENIILNRQYSDQNYSNYRNQTSTNRQFTQLFASDFAFSQHFRTSYQYDKDKQHSFQFKSTYYNFKTYVSGFV